MKGTNKMRLFNRTLATLVAALLPAAAFAQPFILLQSTTSTQNSGLFDHLLPRFEKDSGIAVRVVAVGTGQAIKNAANCDGDVLLAHAKEAEEKFVADGFGIQRFDVMYNDFVVVGPKADPAKVAGSKDVLASLGRIARAKAAFASRGDDSGTHKKEQELWAAAKVDVKSASGQWYRETGSGMGATLNIAAGMNAYALTDRATWLSFGNRQNLDLLVEGDTRLFNQYGVVAVNPAKCPNVKAAQAQQFIDWLLSQRGQAAVADFKLNGQPMFFPNAK